jgi:hypothetical protein
MGVLDRGRHVCGERLQEYGVGGREGTAALVQDFGDADRLAAPGADRDAQDALRAKSGL